MVTLLYSLLKFKLFGWAAVMSAYVQHHSTLCTILTKSDGIFVYPPPLPAQYFIKSIFRENPCITPLSFSCIIYFGRWAKIAALLWFLCDGSANYKMLNKLKANTLSIILFGFLVICCWTDSNLQILSYQFVLWIFPVFKMK